MIHSKHKIHQAQTTWQMNEKRLTMSPKVVHLAFKLIRQWLPYQFFMLIRVTLCEKLSQKFTNASGPLESIRKPGRFKRSNLSDELDHWACGRLMLGGQK